MEVHTSRVGLDVEIPVLNLYDTFSSWCMCGGTSTRCVEAVPISALLVTLEPTLRRDEYTGTHLEYYGDGFGEGDSKAEPVNIVTLHKEATTKLEARNGSIRRRVVATPVQMHIARMKTVGASWRSGGSCLKNSHGGWFL